MLAQLTSIPLNTATVGTTGLLADAGRGPGGGGGPFVLFPLFLLLLGGFLLFRFVRRGRGHHYRNAMMGAVGVGAIGVLGERFARGEITRQEFEYRRSVLRGDDDVPPAPSGMAQPSAPSADPSPPPAPAPASDPVDPDDRAE